MYAKTGVLYPMPRYIAKYGRPMPYFMRYRSDYYRRSKLSRTTSNMNRLCYELERWDKRLNWGRSETKFDHSIMIGEEITVDESIAKKIEQVYMRFLYEMSELARFQHMCRNYDRFEDELSSRISKTMAMGFEVNWGCYYERYRRECAELCSESKMLANIAVMLCYEKYPKKPKNFMWVVASGGILQNIKQVRHELPVRDPSGEFEYLGKKYSFAEYEGELI